MSPRAAPAAFVAAVGSMPGRQHKHAVDVAGPVGFHSRDVRRHVRVGAFHPAGEVHTNRWHDSAARCFHVEAGPTLLNRLHTYSLTLDQPVLFADGPARWLMQRIYDEFRCTDAAMLLTGHRLVLQ